MAEKYKNKYRIPSARLQNWDYGSNAIYFITICTHNRQHYFGEIVKTQCIASPHQMQLSELGKHVEKEWLKTFDLRPDMNLLMGEYVVMPNHFHAIIGIGANQYNSQRETQRRDAMHRVSTTNTTTNTAEYKNQFGPQSKNLASIIRGFKSSVTTYSRKNDLDFAWQSRFYDHIIRNEKSYHNIVQYIVTNPQNWNTDKFRN